MNCSDCVFVQYCRIQIAVQPRTWISRTPCGPMADQALDSSAEQYFSPVWRSIPSIGLTGQGCLRRCLGRGRNGEPFGGQQHQHRPCFVWRCAEPQVVFVGRHDIQRPLLVVGLVQAVSTGCVSAFNVSMENDARPCLVSGSVHHDQMPATAKSLPSARPTR